jgi:hypothetical protein
MRRSPNLILLLRIARNTSIRRPDYDHDDDGNLITEDSPDRKPSRTKSVDEIMTCKSCGIRYPFNGICGYCWSEVRKMERQ